VSGETPLVFWGLLSLGQERKVAVRAQAVAGVSAPLCTACGIEPLAIAAIDTADTTHFGFTPNIKYTLGYQCTGLGNPGALQGTSARIPYLILNRLNTDAQFFADPGTQLFRIGAQGLIPSTNSALGCMQIAAEEQVWENAGPTACNQNPPSLVTAFVCGLASRFESAVPGACANVAEADSAAQAYQPDTDLADVEDHSTYTGNGRRLITVAIVETLNGTGTNTVLGFRQFLVDPNPNETTVNVADSNARFVALYVGSVSPIRQGRFDGCTQQSAGPGKVVLFQ
jgi:hypothetical protein